MVELKFVSRLSRSSKLGLKLLNQRVGFFRYLARNVEQLPDTGDAGPGLLQILHLSGHQVCAHYETTYYLRRSHTANSNTVKAQKQCQSV